MRIVCCLIMLLTFARTASAQCTKDTDCKGDRICIEGKCQGPTASSPKASDALVPPDTKPAQKPAKKDDEPPPPPKGNAPAPKHPLVALARGLAEQLNMPADRQQKVLTRLGHALNRDRVQREHESDRLICVVAYQMGEGGFIVKKTKGKGLIQCLDATEPRAFTIKSTTFGAMVGGSSEWGVGLVLGLKDVTWFGGDYKGSTRGATAGDASTAVSELKVAGDPAPERYHELFLIGAASGLSANAGGSRLTLQLD